jgi:hypothetical protein
MLERYQQSADNLVTAMGDEAWDLDSQVVVYQPVVACVDAVELDADDDK